MFVGKCFCPLDSECARVCVRMSVYSGTCVHVCCVCVQKIKSFISLPLTKHFKIKILDLDYLSFSLHKRHYQEIFQALFAVTAESK